jgi:hypothetical protein
MKSRTRWSYVLTLLGGVGMILGTVDPLEGSLLILPGSGLVALAMFLAKKDRRTVLYWAWAFMLIALGVSAMFALSVFGGIGGRSGHSIWWGLLIIPYPAGWLMALAGAVAGLVRVFKQRQAARA